MTQSIGLGTSLSRPLGPSFSDKILFWASFFTLIAAGMGASIRNEILGDWGTQFGFTQSELGEISGLGLAGFGLTIIFFSFFTDLLGYGTVMIFAFLFPALSVAVTLAAPFAFQHYGKEGAFWALYIGQLCFSLANGTCEAVINPLTASLFPRNKTHWLNILHAGWPGGLVLGALVALGLNQIPGGVNWQIKWGIIFAPMALYGVMMVGRRFPRSEARASGITMKEMMGVTGLLGFAVVMALIGFWLHRDIFPGLEGASWVPNAVKPIFKPVHAWYFVGGLLVLYWIIARFAIGAIILAFLLVLHGLVGYVELGTDNWIVNIGNTVLADKNWALVAFIWTNVLMFVLRFFAGPIVHKISPVGLLLLTALLGTAGLYLLGQPFTNTAWTWMAAVTVYSLGKTFYWPTMLGVISERYPKGGALALGFSGGIGMLSAGLLGATGIGYNQDLFATQKLQQLSPPTYERYHADTAKDFPPVSGIVKQVTGHDYLPEIAGIDNAKYGVLTNNAQTLRADLKLLHSKGEQNEDLSKLESWWETTGQPHAAADKPPLEEARIYGGKMALKYTAIVPATLAVGYLLLLLYFWATGGYRQVHIDQEE